MRVPERDPAAAAHRLAAREVVVFHADPAAPSWTGAEGDVWLDDAERRRAAGFKLDAVRREYVSARRLQRVSLSRCAAVDPAEWRFAAAPGGRPEISAPAAFQRLRFSVTHTSGLIACAVAWDVPVGVDAEALERPVEAEALASRFFAAEETAALLALPTSLRKRRFLEHWTLKEACFKALGTGLTTPLDALRLAFADDGRVSAAFSPRMAETAAAWTFELHAPTGEHVLALAVRTGGRARRVTRVRVLRI